MTSGLIFDIRRYSIHDGPGIRTTVFLKGCPMQCWWCHNPESQKGDIEMVQKENRLEGRIHIEESAVGSWQLASGVIEIIERDAVFYQESGGGVTFSGGEPLMQPEFLAEVLTLCKERGYHTAIDTCGHADPAAFRKVLELADLWLYDLKLMDDIKHVEYTGVSNELSLSHLEMLARLKKDIIVRFPVIPEITDTQENIEAIAELMTRLGLKRIDLLPFHAIARDKYRRLGRQYLMNGVKEPSAERMEGIKSYFSARLLVVNVGG